MNELLDFLKDQNGGNSSKRLGALICFFSAIVFCIAYAFFFNNIPSYQGIFRNAFEFCIIALFFNALVLWFFSTAEEIIKFIKALRK